MENYKQVFKEFSIFFAVAQDLNMILSIQKSRLWGVKDLYTQFSTKEKEYQLEIHSLGGKLKHFLNNDLFYGRWRFTP